MSISSVIVLVYSCVP